MTRLSPRTLLLAALALAPLAHTQTPPQSAPSAQAPVPTLQANARLVLVDVVVTDAHQNPVHNLKAADFTLTENKTPQALKSFDEHTALAPTEAARFDKPAKLPPGVFTNQAPTPVNSAINILLLDTLNTPLQDQSFVRSQLLDYLKSARPGTSVAIFGLTTRLLMLQGFTADPEVLKAAITRKRGQASALLDDAVGGSGVQDSFADQLAESGVSSDQLLANAQDFEAEQKSFQLQLRAKYTLDALNTLARYLSGIPGRKNLIWFSGSFPVNILPDGETTGNPFAGIASSEAEFRETTNLLTRAQVAVYPIDARGLMVSPTLSASNSGARYARNPRNFAKDEAAFSAQTTAEHSTMLQMAADTGGKAFLNTNGLSQAVSSAINLGSNYYTLAYTPTATKGGFRSIQVKLQQSGYTLAYRHGYYTENAATPAATTLPAPDTTRGALTHGAPPATQLLFSLSVLPTSTTDDDKPATGNVPTADKRAVGPYRTYRITWQADPRPLAYGITADGNYHASIEFLAILYDADGTLINSQTNNVAASLSPAQYTKLQTGTLSYHQQISVPTKGDFYLRLALRDRLGNTVGATELPIAAVKNLPPPPPPPSSPAAK